MRFFAKRQFVHLSLASLALGSAVALAADAPSDAEIAGIVVTANTVDIEAGKWMESKSHNKEVKDFATRMVTDHSAVNKQASELAAKLHLQPADSEVSKSLKEGGHKNLAELKKKHGAALEKAYIDHEVSYHETVLEAIDKTLIPNAKNAELKGLIEKVRPAIAAHLDHARKIQAELGKKK